MGELADKRLGDFLPTIDAYRPVALTVAAILLLVLVLPGAESSGEPTVPDFASAAASEDSADAGVDSTVSGGGVATPVGSGDAPAIAPASPPVASSSRPAAVTPSPSPSPAPSPATSASSDPAPAPRSAAGVGSGSDPTTDAGPLRIVETGWASSTGGSPLPTATAERIPDGTLPVGTRVGQHDKVSFLRLSGSGSALVLAEDAGGRRGGSFEAPPVQLCQVTDGAWEAGEGQAMADAPDHDPDRCIAGQQQPDGTWSFLLSIFDDPADERGFALVPTDDAPLDFQVTFASQAIG
jgi:hypothetical protein